MTSAQDPFYIVKEEIQDSIDKLVSSFHQWERAVYGTNEQQRLTDELYTGCESIQWQHSCPATMSKSLLLIERLMSWTKQFLWLQEILRTMVLMRLKLKNVAGGLDQHVMGYTLSCIWCPAFSEVAQLPISPLVGTVKKKVSASKELNYHDSHLELMRLPVEHPHQTGSSNQYGHHNDDFISSESDRQLLLIKEQDKELDELSLNVQRMGAMGLSIHEELLSQEKIIDDLGVEMDSTSNRLDFLQKKVAIVMKKAGAKGQIMMLLFLMVLFIVLFILVFFT